MKNVLAGLLVAVALGLGAEALVACGGGGSPPPMVLNTEATFDPFVTVGETSTTDEGQPVPEVM